MSAKKEDRLENGFFQKKKARRSCAIMVRCETPDAPTTMARRVSRAGKLGFQQSDQAGLLKVVIRGQSFTLVAQRHEDKADGIAKGPAFVQPPLQQSHGRLVQVPTDKNHFDQGVDRKIGHKIKDFPARQSPRLGQGNELRQDVTVREPSGGALEKLHGLSVLRLRPVMKTEKP
jgi:hypothetical protein